jgi:hypothetical protein
MTWASAERRNMGRPSLTAGTHRGLPLIALAVLTLVLAACGSSGGAKTTTPLAPTPAPNAPTPVPTPLVTGSHVNSTGVGYEADIPAGWHLVPNIITSPTFRGDAYFKDQQGTPDPTKGQTNVSIGCQPKTAETGTLDDEVAAELKGLRQLKRENIRTSDHAPVAGRSAKQIDFVYRLNASGPTPVPPTPVPPASAIVLDQRLIVFVADSCVWKVTLSAPAGTLDPEVPVLEAFLASLKLHA